MKKAVIIIPTYNEAKNVNILINKLFVEIKNIKNWLIEILIVDSKSPDGTADIIKSLQKKNSALHLLVTEKEGLGKAYIRGFNYAIAHLNPYVVFEMDADLSHDAKEIAEFLRRIAEGADFVIGSRYIKGGSIPKNWGWHRKIFSFIGNLTIRLGFMKLKITDWTDGYRAIKTWVIKGAMDKIKSYSGYVFQIALLDYAVKNQAVITEIPINFKERYSGYSKINSLEYIIQILLYVISNSSFIKYVIVGLIGFTIDFSISFFIIEKMRIHKNLFWAATLISAEIAIFSNFLLNNFWSFAYKKLENKLGNYILSFLKFNFVSAGALLIQAVGIQICANLFGAGLWYVYKVLIIVFIIIPYSYVLYNRFIWKDK